MAHHTTDDDKRLKLGRRQDGRYIAMDGQDMTCKCCCNHKGVMQDKDFAEPRLICTRCHNAKFDDNIREASKQTAEGDAELERIEKLHDPRTIEYERAAEMRHFCEENKMTKEEIDDERSMNLRKPKGTAHDPNHCGPLAKKKSPFKEDADSNDNPIKPYYSVKSTPEFLGTMEDSQANKNKSFQSNVEQSDVIQELKEEIRKLKEDKKS